jgi:hypothetical protein
MSAYVKQVVFTTYVERCSQKVQRLNVCMFHFPDIRYLVDYKLAVTVDAEPLQVVSVSKLQHVNESAILREVVGVQLRSEVARSVRPHMTVISVDGPCT